MIEAFTAIALPRSPAAHLRSGKGQLTTPRFAPERAILHSRNPSPDRTGQGFDERRRRESAVRAGIASATIEGGSVGLKARAIMHRWAQGLITGDQALQQIDTLHIQLLNHVSSAGQ